MHRNPAQDKVVLTVSSRSFQLFLLGSQSPRCDLIPQQGAPMRIPREDLDPSESATHFHG